MRFLKTAAVFVLVFVLGICFRATLKRYTPRIYGAVWGTSTIVASPAAAIADPVRSQAGKTFTNETLARAAPGALERHEKIFPTGILRRGNRIIVQMSDGSKRTEEDNVPDRYKAVPDAGKVRLAYATRNFVVWDGERMWLKPAPKESRGLGSAETPEKPDDVSPAEVVADSSAESRPSGNTTKQHSESSDVPLAPRQQPVHQAPQAPRAPQRRADPVKLTPQNGR
jgi:hypothetical protein